MINTELFEKLNDEVTCATPQYAREYISSKVSKEELIEFLAYEFDRGMDGHLHYLVDLYNDDENYVIPALKKNGYAIKGVSDRLRNDKEIVLIAVQERGWALEYIPEIFKKDFDIVLAAVSADGRSLEYADKKFCNNEKIVTAALKNDPLAIVYAGDRFKKKKENIINAVKYFKEISEDDFKYALFAEFRYKMAEALLDMAKYHKKDNEIALEMAKSNEYVFKDLLNHFDKKIGFNDDVITALAINHPESYHQFPDRFKNDINVVELVVRNGFIVNNLPEKYRKNRNLILLSVKYNGCNLYYYKDFQNDREVVYEAVKQNGLALEYASEALAKDKELIKIAIQTYAEAYKYFRLKDDIEFALELLEINPFIINYVADELQRAYIRFYQKIFTNENSKLYVDTEFRYVDNIVEDISHTICKFENSYEIAQLIMNRFIKDYKESKNKPIEVTPVNNEYLSIISEIKENYGEDDTKEEYKNFFDSIRINSNKRWKRRM